MALTYELIGSVTANGSSNTLQISNIPQTYNDIVVRASLRGNLNSIATTMNMTFQSVSGTRRQTYFKGEANSVLYAFVDTGSAWSWDYAQGNTAAANTFSFIEVYIPGYATTDSKQSYATYGMTGSSLSSNYGAMAGNFITFTSAITQINLQVSNLAIAGSNMAIYGIKRA